MNIQILNLNLLQSTTFLVFYFKGDKPIKIFTIYTVAENKYIYCNYTDIYCNYTDKMKLEAESDRFYLLKIHALHQKNVNIVCLKHPYKTIPFGKSHNVKRIYI